MTLIPPKEKAKELIDKFNLNGLEQAKRAVLITMIEGIDLLYLIKTGYTSDYLIEYFTEISNEIKKI